MSTETISYIILAGLAALALALFQYWYKAKFKKLKFPLTFLRFLTYFALLLLLINPKFERNTVYSVKPDLILAFDDSESIRHLNQDSLASSALSVFRDDSELNSRFDINYYKFGLSTDQLDSLSFSQSQSNINSVFTELKQVYKGINAPVILVSDGNQTFGRDYEFGSLSYDQAVFPLILGDSITYSDLKIEQLNVNKYAYLNNRFPVEVFVSYSGSESVQTELLITSGNSVLFRQTMEFDENATAKTIQLDLPASRVGVLSYNARIVPLDAEKNKTNNNKPFAVEVIDQKTNVAIVSDISHPDLGALKKSILSNEQRSVSILKPSEFLRRMDDFQLVILYQPNSRFRSLYEALDNADRNRFVITGLNTQWSFLNGIQDNYEQEITAQSEDYQAELNSGYNTFIVDDIYFSSLPPLRSEFGETEFNLPYQTLLYKSINGNVIPEPLLLTFEEAGRREALLLGEDIWKWRAQSYLNNESFETFDNFFGKLVQYLSADRMKRRLIVNYESFYNGNSNIIITAQYFNKNYEFDNQANLEIRLRRKSDESLQTVPFVIMQNNYQVDLSGLEPGEYAFTVRTTDGEISQSGSLTVLDYNVEKQFLNADYRKLMRIASNSGGKGFLITQITDLIADLKADPRFRPVQKSTKNIVPLIDFKWLLAIIALSLAAEWFTRKYNGLI